MGKHKNCGRCLYEWSTSRFPVSDGFMSTYKAAFEKHFGDITQAQFVAQLPQDREEDDVCGKFKIVKGM
jgi:hypothetical protein